MKPSMQRHKKLGTNSTHHQNGALSSHSDETRSEIHAKPRWFATSETRCSSAGGCGIFAGMAGADISVKISQLFGSRLCRILPFGMRLLERISHLCLVFFEC